MIKNPSDRIKRRFELNIQRVKSLIILYDLVSAISKISKSRNEDLLRSAVVFLHASLDDLLREALRVKLPLQREDFAKTLCLEVDGTLAHAKEKFTILDLIQIKDKTVQDVIDESISYNLSRRSFNQIKDVTGALTQISIDLDQVRPYFASIEAAMKRRHIIVHQSDRKSHSDKSHGVPQAIAKTTVEDWLSAVDSFGTTLLGLIGATPSSPQTDRVTTFQMDPLPTFDMFHKMFNVTFGLRLAQRSEAAPRAKTGNCHAASPARR